MACCRRHFRKHFLKEDDSILLQNSLKFVPKGIGSGNGLVSKSQQAITWTNADRVIMTLYLGTHVRH